MRVGSGSVTDDLVTLIAAAQAGQPVLVAPVESAVTGFGPELTVLTSGSAGRPRPVARSWASWLDSFPALTALSGLSSDDRVLLTGPLTASLHLFAALHTLRLGGEITDSVAAATAVHAVPTLLDRLLDVETQIRRAVVAGAALPAHTATRAAARGMAVLEYYGATELSFVATRRPPEPFQPFPSVEVQAAEGLLWARSPWLASGYVGAGAPLRRDADGFVTVGDRGEVGDDGSVLVAGRADSAITCGGETVLAHDVEAVLETLPGVRGAIVVGLGHPRLGEIPAAVVELAGTDLDGVRASARVRLSGAALPRRWRVVARLPRTASGKPDRAGARRALLDPGYRFLP